MPKFAIEKQMEKQAEEAKDRVRKEALFCCTQLLQNLTLEELMQMCTTANDEHWLDWINQCRSIGLTDCQ